MHDTATVRRSLRISTQAALVTLGLFLAGSPGLAGPSCGGAFRAADFNGDGRTDRLCSQDGVTKVQLSTGSGFASPTVWLGQEFAHQLGYPLVADFNGDGKADVAAYEGTTKVFTVAVSTGSQFQPLAAWGTATATWTNGQSYSCDGTGSARSGTGNFDGNGYADVHCRGASGTKILVGKSTGAGFTFSVFAEFSCWGSYERAGPADFDGDGRDDWYCIDGYGGLFARLSNGTAFENGTFQGMTGVCEKDDWSFADMNGDARTDVACRPNGFVGLSTGAAIMDSGSTGPWCNNEKTSPDGGSLRSQMQPLDVDGDARPELVCTYAGPYVRDVHYRKWNGQTLGPVQTLVESWCVGSIQGGDFDGDGKFELVCDNDWAIGSGTPNVVPDLMVEAANGIGGTTTAAYAPSSTFGCNKPPVRQVLTSLTGRDGRGGTSTTTYSYCGGRSDPAQGVFLGYQQVRATAPCLAGEPSCPYTETQYSQELRTLGRPTLVRRSDGAGHVLQQTQTFFHPQSGPSLPRQALVKEVRTTDFALPSGGDTRTTSVSYEYDGYGNVREQLSHGLVSAAGLEDPNDELKSVMTYWPADTRNYLVSRRHTTQVSEQRGQGWVLLKSNEMGYTVGDLTSVKTYVLPGSTSVLRTLDYYPSGQLKSVKSELGAETTITLTDDGLHPRVVTNPDGAVTTTWHSLCDSPSQVTDPNGTITTGYDELCRPKRTEGPVAGAFAERFYNALGDPALQHVRTETPGSSGTGTDYAEEYFDGLGRTYRSQRRGPSAQDIVTERSYNARGSVSSVTAPFYEGATPETTQYSYDSFDRVVSILPPDGNSVTKSYGLWTETTVDPKGKETTVERGTKSSVERTTIGPDPVVTTTAFDMLGRRWQLDDGHQNLWTWTYDSLDRPLNQVDPDSGNRGFTYNDVARTQTRTDALGQTITTSHDTLGRVTSKTSAVGTATFTYGQPRSGFLNTGRLTTVVSPEAGSPNTTLEMDYDAAGQVVHLKRTIPSVGHTSEVSKQFDAAGRMTSQTTYPGNDSIGPLAYDGAGRLTAIPGILTSVTYDAAGRPLVQTNANGTVTTRSYDLQRGVLNGLQTTSPASTDRIQSLTYGYDPDLPLVSSVESPVEGEGWTYEYDDGYRLWKATSHTSAQDNQTFVYDTLGRITSNSRVGDYTYPLDGQPRPHAPILVAGALYQYNAVGNLTSGGGRTPTWDAENRIQAISATTTGTTTFTYDAFGERIKKVSAQGTSLYPFGDDYEITNGVTTKYISVEGLGVIAKKVTGGATPGTYWIHTDRLGSIQAITKATGEEAHRRTYRPYGETLGTSGTHTESRGWIDQRNDPETGLTYLHARYSDPKLGIFLSPDPIGVAGGMNLYGYGLGNPLRWTDRSGLASQVCYIMPPGSAGCGTNPSCTNPAPNVECWTTDEHVNVPIPPGPTTPDGERRDDSDGQSQEGHGQEGKGEGQGQDRSGTPGNPSCTGADCVPPVDPQPTKERPPDPVNWWAEYFSAIPGSVVAEFGEGGCGTVFLNATRDALLPFSLSAASAGEPLTLVWSAHQYNAALQYAASRPNYLGGTGLVYPMKSSVFRAGLHSAKVTAVSGPLVQLNLAIGQGLAVEMHALANGQCR